MYCNYSKDKFGNELTFVEPSWWDSVEDSVRNAVIWVLSGVEMRYIEMLNGFVSTKKVTAATGTMTGKYSENYEMGAVKINPLTPQQARQILPNALKTELVMTGFVSDWKHLFRLRTSIIAETGKPHPDMSALIDPLYKEFIERSLIESNN